MRTEKKNCLLCAEPFVPRRSDAVFCSGSCRAKYSRLKKAGELSGLQLQSEEINDAPRPEKPYKEPTKIDLANTVDARDLAPFLNIVDEDDLSTSELKEGNTSEELNEEINSKPESKVFDTQRPTASPQKFVTKIVKHENPAYKMISDELAQCRNDRKIAENEIARLTQLIQQVKSDNGSGYLLAGAGIGFGGPLVYNHFHTKDNSTSLYPDKILDKDGKPFKAYNRKRIIDQAQKPEPAKSGLSFWEILLYGALGTAVGYIAKNATEDTRQKEKARNIAELQKLIAEYQLYLPKLRERETNLFEELSNHPAYIEKEEQVITAAFDFYQVFSKKLGSDKTVAKAENNLNKPAIKTFEPEGPGVKADLSGIDYNKNDEPMPKKKELETDKIKSMDSISKEKKPLLNFQGKWYEFLGQPQTNFYCAIHGMSGEGKSHLAMQFGKYLAQNFGNVLYVSGEEGFSVTFQKKIAAIGANVPRFYATELKTGEEILSEVPNRFHFIIIDSLNNMGIDPEMMNAIRAKFNKTGIIAICQSTKDGKIRGSYQTVHDTDITIKVMHGIATTTKNRFHQVHQDFDVFPMYKKKKEVGLKNQSKIDDLDQDFDNTI